MLLSVRVQQFAQASDGSTLYQAARDLYVGVQRLGPSLASVDLPNALGHTIRGRRFLINAVKRLSGNVVVLHAGGGHGKTTVAMSLAHEVRSRGLRHIWWVDATNADTLSEGLREVALRIGAPKDDVLSAWSGRSSAPDLLWHHLRQLSDPWLLVLDNADDAQTLSPGGRGWLRPPPASRMVLVTSRDGRVRSWDRAKLVRVPPLETPDGAAVLLELASEAGSLTAAEVLATKLGGLPLGLRIAGMQLGNAAASPRLRTSSTPRTFAEYAAALDRGLARSGVTAPGEAFDERRSLSHTWELSLDFLAERGRPLARPLFRLLATFAPAPLPAELLDAEVLARSPLFADITVADLEMVVEDLVGLGLVESTRGRVDMLTLHPLVRETTLGQPDLAAYRADYAAVQLHLISTVLADLSHDDPATWPRWRALLPHCNQLSYDEVDADDLGMLLEVVRATAAFCDEAELVSQADALHDVVVAVHVAARGAEHESTLAARHKRARHQHKLTDPDEDEVRAVLEIEEGLFGPTDDRTLETRRSLAMVLHSQGHLAEAETEYEAVLDLRLATLGVADPATLASVGDLARLLADRGFHNSASEQYETIYEALRTTVGEEHKLTLAIRHRMAVSLAEAGGLPQAVDELEVVLRTRTRLLGEDHPDTLTTAHELARALLDMDEFDKAEQRLFGVLARRVRILGEDHPSTEATRIDLAAAREGVRLLDFWE